MKTLDVQTRHGLMRVVEDDIWVSRSLRELGEYSQTELNFMEFILSIQSRGKFDGVVVDAGAYIGDLTIPLSRLARKVYAFEPQEEIREILLHNLHVNGCTNVEVIPCALGNESGTLTYAAAGAPGSPGSTIMGDPSGDASTAVVTLDSLELTPDFIKADVEGMELALLSGGLETLTRSRAALFLERDTVVVEGQDLGETLDFLGYRQYPMNFPLWNPRNFCGRTDNPFGATVSHMVLGLPVGETCA